MHPGGPQSGSAFSYRKCHDDDAPARPARTPVRKQSVRLPGHQPAQPRPVDRRQFESDKVCNFDCIYCQVDRTVAGDTRFVELDQLLTELDAMLAIAASGQIYETDKFRSVPPSCGG